MRAASSCRPLQTVEQGARKDGADDNLPRAGMEVYWADTDQCAWLVQHAVGTEHIEIGNSRISRFVETRIWGRNLDLQAPADRAVTDRVAKAWKAFRAQQDGICCRNIHQSMRLRYLDAVVKPTILWGLSAIDPTAVTLTTVRHTTV